MWLLALRSMASQGVAVCREIWLLPAGLLWPECEMFPHRLGYLNAWSEAGGPI